MIAKYPVIAESMMLDVGDVAELLNCSSRHVYRLADAGKMPPPIKLGALVRWDKSVLAKWIADGCPPIRRAGRTIR